MGSPVLDVRELSVSYGPIEAVCGVSFTVGKGEIVALIGANGAGKSSCVNAIVGLVPSSGTILLKGRSIRGLAPDAMIGLGLTLVPEGRRVFPGLSVMENLIAGSASRGRAERRENHEVVMDLFPSLRSRLRQVAGTLSGGEQQMLAIGRALMGSPDMLLLDEPSLGLAPQIIDEIFQLVAGLRRRGVSILLVEQNAERAIGISDRTIVLKNGRIGRSDRSDIMLQSNLAELLFVGGVR